MNDAFDISWEVDESTGAGRHKATINAKKKPKKPIQAIDDFSDLDDFIVNDDEEERGSYRPGRQRKRKAKVNVIQSSSEAEESESEKKKDDTYEISDNSEDEELGPSLKSKRKSEARKSVDSDVETSPVKRSKPSARVNGMEQPKMLSSFIPSTKMKHMMSYLQEHLEANPDDKVSPSSVPFFGLT